MTSEPIEVLEAVSEALRSHSDTSGIEALFAVIDQGATLNRLRQDYQDVATEADELEEKVNDLSLTIAQKDKTIASLQADVAARDGAIRSLNEQLRKEYDRTRLSFTNIYRVAAAESPLDRLIFVEFRPNSYGYSAVVPELDLWSDGRIAHNVQECVGRIAEELKEQMTKALKDAQVKARK